VEEKKHNPLALHGVRLLLPPTKREGKRPFFEG
jgi:hypothetical protein